MNGGKYGNSHRFANFVCENSQTSGGKYRSSHRIGTNAATTREDGAAAAFSPLTARRRERTAAIQQDSEKRIAEAETAQQRKTIDHLSHFYLSW
jgi:hypothetical protein